MKNIIYIAFIFVVAFAAKASETVHVKFEKLEYLIQLPKPFKKTHVGVELNNKTNALNRVHAKGKFINVNINSAHLSLYKNIDLTNIRVYEGNPIQNITDDNIDAYEYLIDDFSLCFEYGEYKKGKRLNKEGWYKDSLRILIKKNGSYELISNPVDQQNIPDGVCIK